MPIMIKKGKKEDESSLVKACFQMSVSTASGGNGGQGRQREAQAIIQATGTIGALYTLTVPISVIELALTMIHHTLGRLASIPMLDIGR